MPPTAESGRPDRGGQTLPDLFDIAYLINLPERSDRLKSAKRQFARVGWSMGSGGVCVFPALRFTEAAGFPSAPVRGCFHSHLECLRRAYAERMSSVMIIEDDVALSTSLPRLTASVQAALAQREWDFVYLGHYGTGDTAAAQRHTRASELRFDEWRGGLMGTEFYAVNGRVLSRLIAHLEKIANGRPGDQCAGPMPVDGAYNIFRRENPDVRCLVVRPRLGWQMPFRSDITPHTLDKLEFLRPATGFLRKFKRMAELWGS